MTKEPSPRLGISIERVRSEARSSTLLRGFWILLAAALLNGLIYAGWVWNHDRERADAPAEEFVSGTKTVAAANRAAPEDTISAVPPEPVPQPPPAVVSTEPAPVTEQPEFRSSVVAPSEAPNRPAVVVDSSEELAATAATPVPAPKIIAPPPIPKPAEPIAVAKPAAPLPAEVTLKKPAELTVRRDGKLVGFINLKKGQKAKPLSVKGDKLEIGWHEATGEIPIADTDYKP